MKFRSTVRHYVYRHLHRDVYCNRCARPLAPDENKIGHLYRVTEHRVVAQVIVPEENARRPRRRPSSKLRDAPVTRSMFCFCGESYDVYTDVLESRFLAHVYTCLFGKELTPALRDQYESINEVGRRAVIDDDATGASQINRPSTSLPVKREEDEVQVEIKENRTEEEESSWFSVARTNRRNRRRTVVELRHMARSNAFTRLLTRYARSFHLDDRLVCKTCDEKLKPNAIQLHGKRHCSGRLSDVAVHCPLCGNYLFYANCPLLEAQWYYHTLKCLWKIKGGGGDESSSTIKPVDEVFDEFVRQYPMVFVVDESFEPLFVRSEIRSQDLPTWTTYHEFVVRYTKLYVTHRRSRDNDQVPNRHLRPIDYLADLDSESLLLTSDENALNLTRQNDYVSDDNVTYVEVDRMLCDHHDGDQDVAIVFHCRPEIDRLRAVSRLDELDYAPSLRIFRTNERMRVTYDPRPVWILDALKSVYRPGVDDHLDVDLCGLSVWTLALARLLPSSVFSSPDVPNSFSFAHVFIYESVANFVLDELSDSTKYYVLPYSCLCYDTQRPVDEEDNMHRHLICVFASPTIRTSFSRRLAAYRRRSSTSTNRTTSTEEDRHIGRQRRKAYYCLSILTKYHYFNVVNYVSRQKIPSKTTLREAVIEHAYDDAEDGTTTVDLPQAIGSLVRVGRADKESLPKELKTGNMVDLQSYARSIVAAARQASGATNGNNNKRKRRDSDVSDPRDDEDDEDKDENEETRDKWLDSHAKNGTHVYVKEPVCSHFLDLVSISYSNGLTELFSRKQLTPRLLLDLTLKSRLRVSSDDDDRRNKINVDSYVIRFDDVRGLIGCNMANHVLPYVDLDRLDSERLTRINSYLRSLGMLRNGRDAETENGKMLTVFGDFTEVDVVLPPVAVSRTLFTRGTYSALLKMLRETRVAIDQAANVIRVQNVVIDDLLSRIEDKKKENTN